MKRGRLHFPYHCNRMPHLITRTSSRMQTDWPLEELESWRRNRELDTLAMQFSQAGMHMTNLCLRHCLTYGR